MLKFIFGISDSIALSDTIAKHEKRQPRRSCLLIQFMKKPSLLQVMFFNEIVDYFFEIRIADFLQIVINPGVRFFDLDQAV